MKNLTCKILLALALFNAAVMQLRAQSYSVDWFKVAGGGGTSTNSIYSISGTFGQPDAGGPMGGGGFSVVGGFWSLFAPVNAPVITAEPVSQTVEAGSNVTIQVIAIGTNTLTYKWLFNGGKLANGSHVSGATNAALILKNVTTANTGSYEVVVTNSYGSATSTVATVTVEVSPSITTQPANESPALGGIATFSVKATGTPLTYQWIFDGAPLSDIGNISGAAGNQLTVDLVASNNVGSYSVIVANSFVSVTSKVVQLALTRETSKPSVAIASPKANSRTNVPVLSGTAWDSVRVLNVAYWVTNVNNGVKTTINGIAALAAGTGSSSNWTIQTPLVRDEHSGGSKLELCGPGFACPKRRVLLPGDNSHPVARQSGGYGHGHGDRVCEWRCSSDQWGRIVRWRRLYAHGQPRQELVADQLDEEQQHRRHEHDACLHHGIQSGREGQFRHEPLCRNGSAV